MVPEWVLDADIGDCALRLYAVLLRYGNTTGARMPARSTLAARLHKKSSTPSTVHWQSSSTWVRCRCRPGGSAGNG